MPKNNTPKDMADEGFKRNLTAILCADVEGYSRLMGEDEEATVRTISYHTIYETSDNCNVFEHLTLPKFL